MKRLYLTRALARSTWGQPNYNPESRFLSEIPSELVERQGEESGPLGLSGSGYTKPVKREQPVMVLVVGDRVLHDKFGMGTVTAITGANEKSEATIDFKSAGEKRLLLRYAPVEKL
jgi:DNA helicase-2/ATP-dependent DNA helicase PcrA